MQATKRLYLSISILAAALALPSFAAGLRSTPPRLVVNVPCA